MFPQDSNTHGQRRLIYLIGQHLTFCGKQGLKAEMLSRESFTILMDAFEKNRVILVGWGQCPNSIFSEKMGAQSKIHGADRVLKPSTCYHDAGLY